MKKPIRILQSIIILLLTLPVNPLFTFAQESVEITYIANEGFLISGKNDKILIDGIFTQGWTKYHTPSQQALTLERKALPPFDSVTVILISHNHADHINADFIVEHMLNNNNSVIICPPDVNSLLAPIKEYETIHNRIITITPSNAAKFDTSVHKLNFKIISLQHAKDENQKIQNLGFIFSINGFKIFHPGDAASNDLKMFENFKLANDSIDIAFLPRWFFDTEYGEKGEAIIHYLKPKAIIMMHINSDKLNYYKNIVTNNAISNVYIMDNQMEQLSFKRNNNSIITNKDKPK